MYRILNLLPPKIVIMRKNEAEVWPERGFGRRVFHVNGGDKTGHGAAQSQASCGVASGMARALAT